MKIGNCSCGKPWDFSAAISLGKHWGKAASFIMTIIDASRKDGIITKQTQHVQRRLIENGMSHGIDFIKENHDRNRCPLCKRTY